MNYPTFKEPGTKVWIVEVAPQYEPGDIVGLFWREEDANAKAKEIRPFYYDARDIVVREMEIE